MGGNYAGAFMMGLSQSLQRAQEQQTQNEYKKALIEQSKLQTKMLENKLNLADQEQGMMRAYLQTKGIQLPAPTQQPLVAQEPQQPQGLLGKLFGGGQVVAPAGQQPRGLIQKVFTGITGQPQPQAPVQQTAAPQAPLPQTIAQGQMQGQMPGMTSKPDEAFMEDLMQKRLFDMPAWRQRFEAESKQVGRTINTIGPNGQPVTIVIDKSGKIMNQAYPTPAEPYRQKVVTPQGTFEVEQPKYGTGGISQVAPPEMERTKVKTNFGDFEVLQPKYGRPGETTQIAPAGEGMTAEKAGKINLIGNAYDRLPEISGIVFPKNGGIDRQTLALGKNIPGMPPLGKGGMLFSKMYQAMDAALRMETGAQANPAEITTKVYEYWPNVYDADETIKEKFKDFEQYIHGAANTIDPTGELRKIRKTGNVPTGTIQGKPSLNLQSNQNVTPQQIENEYQQALKMRPDLAPQLKAKRDQLLQQVR